MPLETRAEVSVFSRSFGTGPVPVLALHCALAHSGAWRGVAQHLGDRATLRTFDLPSHGRSAPWSQTSDIHDLCTEIGHSFLDQPTHLVGHSFGGTVALRLAQDRPERVKSLTLVEPVLFAAARDIAPTVFADHLAASAPFADALQSGDMAQAARHFTARWSGGPPWESLSAEQQEGFAAQMPLIAATDRCLHEDTAGLLQLDRLKRLAQPVQLVRGDQSPAIIAAIQAGLQAAIPQATQHVISGAGHMAPITHADQVAEIVGVLI